MSRSKALSLDVPLEDHQCPNCGAATESIEAGEEELHFQQLQLCPVCYIVTWRDEDGVHIRQGLPLKERAPAGGPEQDPVPCVYQQRPGLC